MTLAITIKQLKNCGDSQFALKLRYLTCKIYPFEFHGAALKTGEMSDVGLSMRCASRCKHGVMTRNKVADRDAILRANNLCAFVRTGISLRVVASVTKEILRNESDLCRAFYVIVRALDLSGRELDISPWWIMTFNADKLRWRASSSIGVSHAP